MTETATPIICLRCGNTSSLRGLFCIHCGTPLSAAHRLTEPAYGVAESSATGHTTAPLASTGYRQPGSASAVGDMRSLAQRAAQDRGGSRLGPAFAGLIPASAGRRVAAYTLDLLAGAAIGALVWLLTASAILAGLAVIELAVGFVVWEARRGTTLGQRLLGVWTTRRDAPMTPGIGRALARASVTGAGTALGVGGFIVAGSSAWDASGLGWQDKLAATRTVVEPDRRAARRRSAQVAGARHTTSGAELRAPVQGYRAPQVNAVAQAGTTPFDDGVDGAREADTGMAGVVGTGAPGSAARPTLAPQATPQSPMSTHTPTAVVFAFDTGQRVRIALTGRGVLGRGPHATADDGLQPQLVTVSDPDMTVSKRHLAFETSSGDVTVTDLSSTNGSAVVLPDGSTTALQAGMPTRVPPGAAVRVGDRTLSIELAY